MEGAGRRKGAEKAEAFCATLFGSVRQLWRNVRFGSVKRGSVRRKVRFGRFLKCSVKSSVRFGSVAKNKVRSTPSAENIRGRADRDRRQKWGRRPIGGMEMKSSLGKPHAKIL